MVLPCMASLVAKKKGHKLYYYVVESARVEGKPRIVHQTYLGTAQKVADLVKDRTAPIPVSAASRDFGLPGALWLAAQQTGVLGVLEALWPAPRSGPSPAHYVLLAALHRVRQPGPQDRGGGLVSEHDSALGLGIAPERLYFSSVLGCVREHSARAMGSAFGRRRSAGPRPTGLAEFMETKAGGEPALYSPTIPPTSTPISPATTRATIWRSAAITSRAGTIFAKWA